MAGESERMIPYRKGEPPPAAGYITVKLVDEDGNDEGLWWVKLNELRHGPIQHEDVNQLLPMLRWTWRHLQQYLTHCRAFEDWELGFLQETSPGTELGYWVRATYAFLEYNHRNPSANKQAVYQAIAMMLLGQDDRVLPRSTATKLRKLAGKPPRILANIENFTLDGRLTTGKKHLR
jgi:hypothetical protein